MRMPTKGYELQEEIDGATQTVGIEWYKPHRFLAPSGEFLNVLTAAHLFEPMVLINWGEADLPAEGYFRVGFLHTGEVEVTIDRELWGGLYDRLRGMYDAMVEKYIELKFYLGNEALDKILVEIHNILSRPAYYEWDEGELTIVPEHGMDVVLTSDGANVVVSFVGFDLEIGVSPLTVGYKVEVKNSDSIPVSEFLPTVWWLSHLVQFGPLLEGFPDEEKWVLMHKAIITYITTSSLNEGNFAQSYQVASRNGLRTSYLVKQPEGVGILVNIEPVNNGLAILFRSPEWGYGVQVWMYTSIDSFHLNPAALEEVQPLQLFHTITAYATQLSNNSVEEFPWAEDIAVKAGRIAGMTGLQVERRFRSPVPLIGGDSITLLDHPGYISIARHAEVVVMETRHLDLQLFISRGQVTVSFVEATEKDLRAAVLEWATLIKRLYAKRVSSLASHPALPSVEEMAQAFSLMGDEIGSDLLPLIPGARKARVAVLA